MMQKTNPAMWPSSAASELSTAELRRAGIHLVRPSTVSPIVKLTAVPQPSRNLARERRTDRSDWFTWTGAAAMPLLWLGHALLHWMRVL